jgi:hypothetical protein
LLQSQLGEVESLIDNYAVAGPRAAASLSPVLKNLTDFSAAVPELDESFCVLRRLCAVLDTSMERTRDLCIQIRRHFGNGDSWPKIDIGRVKNASAAVARAWGGLTDAFTVLDYNDSVQRTREMFQARRETLRKERWSGDRLPPGNDLEDAMLIGMDGRLDCLDWFDQMVSVAPPGFQETKKTIESMRKIVKAIGKQAERPSPVWEQLQASKRKRDYQLMRNKALERRKRELGEELKMLRDAEKEYQTLLEKKPLFEELNDTLENES